jgi:hypothetical protein
MMGMPPRQDDYPKKFFWRLFFQNFLKFLGSLGIAVINPFWYTDLTENTEKERIFKGFSVSSVSSVYKNHGNSQRTNFYTMTFPA